MCGSGFSAAMSRFGSVRKGTVACSGGSGGLPSKSNGFSENEEANVAVGQLLLVLKVCGNFKSTYFDYKAKSTIDELKR